MLINATGITIETAVLNDLKVVLNFLKKTARNWLEKLYEQRTYGNLSYYYFSYYFFTIIF
jgi:hypothetical protein